MAKSRKRSALEEATVANAAGIPFGEEGIGQAEPGDEVSPSQEGSPEPNGTKSKPCSACELTFLVRISIEPLCCYRREGVGGGSGTSPGNGGGHGVNPIPDDQGSIVLGGDPMQGNLTQAFKQMHAKFQEIDARLRRVGI